MKKRLKHLILSLTVTGILLYPIESVASVGGAAGKLFGVDLQEFLGELGVVVLFFVLLVAGVGHSIWQTFREDGHFNARYLMFPGAVVVVFVLWLIGNINT